MQSRQSRKHSKLCCAIVGSLHARVHTTFDVSGAGLDGDAQRVPGRVFERGGLEHRPPARRQRRRAGVERRERGQRGRLAGTRRSCGRVRRRGERDRDDDGRDDKARGSTH
jgi:hypothetical protein